MASESVGSYNDGIVRNSVALDLNHRGIQTMRPWNNRFFGHTDLKSFIYNLGKTSFESGLGQLMIGDLSHEDGGTLSGHASHQNGLDVDIWFYRPADTMTNLPDSQREPSHFPHYLDPSNNEFYPGLWDTKLDQILKLAAEDKRVARIFVNPGIKKRLCSLYPNQDFLKKIRPWFRHHEHFHVRLACPIDSPNCKNQEASNSIECSGTDFDWWFSQDFKDEYNRRYGSKKISQSCDV
jgi:penicillin-insensitive murein endopeptidase